MPEPEAAPSRPSGCVTGRCRSLPRRCAGSACGSGWGSCSPRTARSPPSTPASREQAFYALRATLCSSHADLEPLRARVRRGVRCADAPDGRSARRRWGDRAGPAAAGRRARPRPSAARDAGARGGARRLERGGAAARRRTSPPTPTPSAPPRDGCSRAWPRAARPAQPPHAPGAAARPTLPDLRATIARLAAPGRRAARAPLARARRERPRRLVLVLDVSGSMAPYARMLLQYVQASVAARRARRGVRVRHAAHPVDRASSRGRDPDRALHRAAERVTDWSGGTRIGASLATLNREHGRRIGRGAFVVILSDGWDRGDPDELAAEIGAAAPHARTGWSGSTRWPPTRATSRSRAACARRCRTSTSCCRATTIASLEDARRPDGRRAGVKDVIEEVTPGRLAATRSRSRPWSA